MRKSKIIGDMNIQTGEEIYYQDHIGENSLHEVKNDIGLRLISMPATKGVVVRGTCFDHKNIHKLTWILPDRNTTYQIDHHLVDRRHFTKLRLRISNAEKGVTLGK